MNAAQLCIACPDASGMEKTAFGQTIKAIGSAFQQGMKGITPAAAKGLGGIKPNLAARTAMRAGGMARNFTGKNLYGLKPLGKAINNNIGKVLLPAATGFAGHTIGNAQGQLDGTARTMHELQQNPMGTMGYGLASFFGQGTNAMQSYAEAKMRDPKTPHTMRLALPEILNRVKQLQNTL